MNSGRSFSSFWIRGISCAVPIVFALFGCVQKQSSETEREDANSAYRVSRLPKGVTSTFVDFGGKLHLVGYELSPSDKVRSGDRMKLKLYWSVVSPLQPGYRLATYLIAGRGVETFESGGPLRNAESGPSSWRPGKIYVDEQEFEVPELRGRELTVAVGVTRDALEPEAESAAETEPAAVGPEESATITRPPVRLPVLSGPTDGEERAILGHVANELVVKPKPRARRVPAGGAPPPARPAPAPAR
jgi:hypothetical protein